MKENKNGGLRAENLMNQDAVWETCFKKNIVCKSGL